MKTKRTFLSILTLCIALLFTACSGKGTAGTEKSQKTKTESGSESADDSNSKLNDLYQQENQIFRNRNSDMCINNIVAAKVINNSIPFLIDIFRRTILHFYS